MATTKLTHVPAPTAGPSPDQHPQDEAGTPAPQPITHKGLRPRLSGEGAEAALVHLVEQEKLRIEPRELS